MPIIYLYFVKILFEHSSYTIIYTGNNGMNIIKSTNFILSLLYKQIMKYYFFMDSITIIKLYSCFWKPA